MAKLVSKWGQNLEQISNYHNLGVVVGTTYPQELKAIRKIAKNPETLARAISAYLLSQILGGIREVKLRILNS